MISIILITIGLLIAFVSSVPFSSSRELRRPNTIYFAIVLIILGLIGNFVIFPEQVSAWVPLITGIAALLTATFLSTPKVTATDSVTQRSLNAGRLVNIITWILILGIAFFVGYIGLRLLMG
jgi:sulfite exporter TauE/SafE